jgi:hypothetical protein
MFRLCDKARLQLRYLARLICLLKRPAGKTDLKGTDFPEKSSQKPRVFYGFSRYSGILPARLILLTY